MSLFHNEDNIFLNRASYRPADTELMGTLYLTLDAHFA